MKNASSARRHSRALASPVRAPSLAVRAPKAPTLGLGVALCMASWLLSPGAPVALAQSSATASWALDRLDQDALPLDGRYDVASRGQGAGVTIYVVDGGVLAEHGDFGGRVTAGPDFSGTVAFRGCSPRVPSHGTHTAGLAASRTYGVAKAAAVVDVRVLGCDGMTTKERMEDALRWIAANARKPSVVNMSVGSSNPADAVDAAAQAVIDAGLPLVLSAGNEEIDACRHFPSNVRDAIVVGASSDHDVIAPFSNTGACVDIFAPGWEVLSTMARRIDASGPFYGTSQAAPLVAGAAALYLEKHPDASPREVEEALVRSATTGVLRDANAGTALPGGTPNRLLNVRRLLSL